MEKKQLDQELENAAKDTLKNNELPTEGEFAEGYILGALFGAEWLKEQTNKP